MAFHMYQSINYVFSDISLDLKLPGLLFGFSTVIFMVFFKVFDLFIICLKYCHSSRWRHGRNLG